MPNNATRKAERREKLAAAKAERNAAGVNMFNPRAHVALFNINSSPLGGTRDNPLPTRALHGNVNLRAANLFTGKPFAGYLSPEEIKDMQLLGLPTKSEVNLTTGEQATINAIAAENAANAMATMRRSEPNANGLTGDQYLYSTVYPKSQANLQAIASHHSQQVAETQDIPALRNLDAQIRHLRYNLKDEEGARKLLKNAREIKATAGYTVAEPTARSLANAQAYHDFAKQHYASDLPVLPVLPNQSVQLRPSQPSRGYFGGLFNSCFGGSCSVNERAVQPLTVINPLHISGRHGGRSRKYKRRKYRNKRTHRR
jgi:hypothetical protein